MIEKIKTIFQRLKAIKYTLLKFSVVGASGILVNQGALAVLVSYFEVDVEIAGIVSIELSILTNFLLNNFWTWNHAKKFGFLNRLLKYHMITLVSGGVNYLILLFLTGQGMHYLTANMIGICCGIIINFSINHIWTFQKEDLA